MNKEDNKIADLRFKAKPEEFGFGKNYKDIMTEEDKARIDDIQAILKSARRKNEK